MKVLVTGSSGHLGEALVRTLRDLDHTVVGLDVKASPFTTTVGSITDAAIVRACMDGVQVVFHTATLHKPHIATHSRQAFVDTNVSGTLTLLEAAREAGVTAFLFTSTTSAFGAALNPPASEPTAWITEVVAAIPKNIYGVTKTAAEDLCLLFHRKHDLNCIILRTSRFFPEEDDNAALRANYEDGNLKANEILHRRVDLDDVVSAHLLAWQRAAELGFGSYIISATTPFHREDVQELRRHAPQVVRRRVPGFRDCYQQRGWRMFDGIDRVYVNGAARRDLGWEPRFDFAYVLECLRQGVAPQGSLAGLVGLKRYHDQAINRETDDGPYPVE